MYREGFPEEPLSVLIRPSTIHHDGDTTAVVIGKNDSRRTK